jgi:SEC-C motif-containing protein
VSGFRSAAAAAGSGRCPCGGGSRRLSTAACCGPLLRGERLAATADQLMRSRYSAFALGDVDHLLRTQAQDRSPHQPEPERRRALEETCRRVRWLRLEILVTKAGGPLDLEGTVTFEAHYQQSDGRRGVARRGVMRECSRFGREGGRLEGAWLYLEALELSG